MVLQTFRTYIRLCLFRGSTAQVDHRRVVIMMYTVILLFLMTLRVGLEIVVITQNTFGAWIASAVVLWVFIYLTLAVKKQLPRWRYALSAFIGTRIIFECILCVVLLATQDGQVVKTCYSIIFLWRVGVIGLILRQTTGMYLPMCIGLASVYTAIALFTGLIAFGFIDLTGS